MATSVDIMRLTQAWVERNSSGRSQLEVSRALNESGAAWLDTRFAIASAIGMAGLSAVDDMAGTSGQSFSSALASLNTIVGTQALQTYADRALAPAVVSQPSQPSAPAAADAFYGFDVVQVAITPGSNGFDPSPHTQYFAQYAPPAASIGLLLLQVIRVLATRAAVRGVAFYQSLPGWVKQALIVLGVTLSSIDVDWPFVGDPDSRPFLPDRRGDFIGPVPAPSTGGGPMAQDTSKIGVGGYWDGRVITNVWLANGILFWATGVQPHLMHWVLRKNGSVKGWKPQVPVVLMPGGAKNLRTLIKADAIIDRQMKQLDKIYRRRHPPRRASKALPPGRPMVAIEAGPGSQVN